VLRGGLDKGDIGLMRSREKYYKSDEELKDMKKHV
jgi:hypothetical protein